MSLIPRKSNSKIHKRFWQMQYSLVYGVTPSAIAMDQEAKTQDVFWNTDYNFTWPRVETMEQ